MYRGTVSAFLLCAALFAQNQTRASTPSLLEKLYRLVWPAGRFNGDLVRTVSRNTEKGTWKPDLPQLYLVNAATGAVIEWTDGLEAVEPVLCAADDTLYYRRGSKIFTVPLRVNSSGGVQASGKAAELNAPPISSIVACTGTGKTWLLWVEATDGRLVRLVRKETKLVPASSGKTDFEETPTHALADYLRIMRSMRPDGFTVAVVNKVLVGEKPSQERFLIVHSDSVQFAGVPAWVPNTDLLFVTGMKEGLE